ncbi:MAG TPA: hypothetical protein VF153_08125 [Candidatus Limnocylindria bacterium]
MTERPVRPARAQRPWSLIVGLALVVLLSAVIVIALLLSGPDADASSTATPSTSELAPASATATQSATPTASQAAVPSPPELPDGLLPAGALITVSSDVLRIRAKPSLDGKILETMKQGDAAYIDNAIDAGPIMADGFAWYQVAYAGGRDVWPFQDVFPGGYVTGWMAAGDDTQPYAVLADVTCPAGELDLSVLANQLTPWERLVCIGSGTVTVEGRYGCDGCGGVTPGASPAWLADLSQAPPVAARGNFYPAVNIAVPPDAPTPEGGDVIRATLHVDDAAASTCVFDPPPDTDDAAYDWNATAVQVFCRERLILESFEVTGHDDFPR